MSTPDRTPIYVALVALVSMACCAAFLLAMVVFREDVEELLGIENDEAEQALDLTDIPTVGPTTTPSLAPSALPTPGGGDSSSGGAAPPSGDLLFVSNRTGQWEIYRMATDGGNVTQLTVNSAGVNYNPDWSPDGSQIVFSGNRDGNWDIYVMNSDGSNQRRLTTGPAIDRTPAWSPRGDLIAFASDRRGNHDIYVMNPDGTNVRALTGSIATDYWPDWSPDGASVVYQSNRDGELQLYRQRIDQWEDQAIQLTTDPISKGSPNWSPDGSRIAFYTNVGGRGGMDIYTVPATGGATSPLANTSNNEAVPEWSPDGRYVYYHIGVLGGTNLGVVDTQTGGTALLTSRGDRNWAPNPRPGSAFGGGAVIVPTIPPPTVAPTPIVSGHCPVSLPTRLRLNEQARARRNTVGFVHVSPSTGARALAQIMPGLVMRTYEGPVCAEGYTWWRVYYGRITGWVIESSRGEYWLESVEAERALFLPPANRSSAPPGSEILTGATGLTDQRPLPPGDFQVEWYCNLQNFGVQNDDHNWYCVQGGQPVFALDVNDLDSICQTTYYHSTAFAIQDGPGAIPAYRWRCYAYSAAPK